MATDIVEPTADSGESDAREERSRDRRADAMQARSVLWHESNLRRLQSCGRWSVRQDGSVAVRVTTPPDGRRSAGIAGVPSCGSVWACPVCARKIATSRQVDIEHACRYWEGQLKGAIALATFTVSHRIGNSLRSVWDAVSAGWHQITAGTAWKRNQLKYGIEGWTRVIEVTHGTNGWHVHVHAVLFLTRGLGRGAREGLTTAMLGRWQTGISKHGFSASREWGADVKMMHGSDASTVLADYFTKGVYTADGSAPRSVGLEAARGDLKDSRGTTRTPFKILRDFVATGDVEDLELWHEWEKGSKGRRQMAWSKGFRDLVRLTEERTDDEIAAEEIGSLLDDVVVLTREGFAAVRYRLHELLDVLEICGSVGLRVWLSGESVDWLDPGQARPAG